MLAVTAIPRMAVAEKKRRLERFAVKLDLVKDRGRDATLSRQSVDSIPGRLVLDSCSGDENGVV